MLTDKNKQKLRGWHKHIYGKGKMSTFELERLCKKSQINFIDAVDFLAELAAPINCKGCQHNLGAKKCILYPCHSCIRRTAEKTRPRNILDIAEKDYYNV